MDFLKPLKERIQHQIGAASGNNGEYAFLLPGGNDHLVQFWFKGFQDALEDFDEWNRNHLWLLEIASQTGVDFHLDDDGRFAGLTSPTEKGDKRLQAVIDLRDSVLVPVYYFGESRPCRQLNQKLGRARGLCPCYLNSQALAAAAAVFEKTSFVQFDFEQLSSLFLEPVVMKGMVKGGRADDITRGFIDRHDFCFNMEAIGGFIGDDASSTVMMTADGLMQGQSCRLSGFLEVADLLFNSLRQRYDELITDHLMTVDSGLGQGMTEVLGSPVEICFPFAVDRVDGLNAFFTRGNRTTKFLGSSERRSRKLWNVKSTEVSTGHQISVEFSERFVRGYLSDRNGVPLIDQAERFIRRHISAVSGDDTD